MVQRVLLLEQAVCLLHGKNQEEILTRLEHCSAGGMNRCKGSVRIQTILTTNSEYTATPPSSLALKRPAASPAALRIAPQTGGAWQLVTPPVSSAPGDGTPTAYSDGSNPVAIASRSNGSRRVGMIATFLYGSTDGNSMPNSPWVLILSYDRM